MKFKRHKPIYTLGTSTRSWEDFAELLTSHGVEVVVDVRRFPSSRFEHFNQQELIESLGKIGIDYVYLGEELGGYRRGGYKGFTATSEFQTGLRKLVRVARRKRVAIACAERFPWRCHRRFIASELEKHGWRVNHIIDQQRDWLPSKLSQNCH